MDSLNDANMKINRQAVFSDGTEYYIFPQEPMEYEQVTLRIRTAKDDIEEASIVLKDQTISMYKIYSEERFDFYEGSFMVETEPVSYHFILQKGEETLYYESGK